MSKPIGAPSFDLERNAKEKFVLDQIGQTLTSDFDLEQLLETIHRQLTQLFEVDNFYVALLAPQRNEIWYPLAVKNGIRQDWSNRPLTDRLTDRVILSGKAILLPHHAGEQIKQIGLQSSDETPHAWIGVPLIASEQTIAAVLVPHHGHYIRPDRLGLQGIANPHAFMNQDDSVGLQVLGQVIRGPMPGGFNDFDILLEDHFHVFPVVNRGPHGE